MGQVGLVGRWSNEVPGCTGPWEYKEEGGFGVSGKESDQDKLIRRFEHIFKVNISDFDNLQKQSLKSLDFLSVFYGVKIYII